LFFKGWGGEGIYISFVTLMTNGVLDTISIPPGGGIEITRTPQNLLTEYVVLDLPDGRKVHPDKVITNFVGALGHR